MLTRFGIKFGETSRRISDVAFFAHWNAIATKEEFCTFDRSLLDG
jgi:hypothetical protein